MLFEDGNLGNEGDGALIFGILMFVIFLLLKTLNFSLDSTNFKGFFYFISLYCFYYEDDELISSNPGFHLY